MSVLVLVKRQSRRTNQIHGVPAPDATRKLVQELGDDVLKVLGEGSAKLKDIAESLAVHEGDVHRVLRHLREAGRVKQWRSYWMTEDERRPW